MQNEASIFLPAIFLPQNIQPAKPMADYYTNFSFVMPLDAAQKQYALQLHSAATNARWNGTPLPDTFPPSLKDSVEDWSFDVDYHADGIWLHSSSGGINSVCDLAQHLVQKFTLAPVCFEWSHDCSKPRTDAYGGGAAIITGSAFVQTMTTADWLRQQVALLPPHKP